VISRTETSTWGFAGKLDAAHGIAGPKQMAGGVAGMPFEARHIARHGHAQPAPAGRLIVGSHPLAQLADGQLAQGLAAMAEQLRGAYIGIHDGTGYAIVQEYGVARSIVECAKARFAFLDVPQKPGLRRQCAKGKEIHENTGDKDEGPSLVILKDRQRIGILHETSNDLVTDGDPQDTHKAVDACDTECAVLAQLHAVPSGLAVGALPGCQALRPVIEDLLSLLPHCTPASSNSKAVLARDVAVGIGTRAIGLPEYARVP
jgi:hypothetical protein